MNNCGTEVKMDRRATIERKTKETAITAELRLDSAEPVYIKSGVSFLDHLLESLAKHARMSITLQCKGDLHIDDHHSVEDCAIVLGQALDNALGERSGINRFGYALAPLDEALARAVVDLSGRPYSVIQLGLKRESIGAVSTENITHFVSTFAAASRSCIHLDVLRGDNDHHRAEAAFKALALALRSAVAIDGGCGIPSTKGAL
jgi:imidazoleglycerol-phosphate dehydratase